jgi:hypothetical protein
MPQVIARSRAAVFTLYFEVNALSGLTFTTSPPFACAIVPQKNFKKGDE